MDDHKLILRPHGGDVDQERYILIEHAPFWVGRRPENDAQIVRPDISGRHAMLQHEEGSWWVVDNNSTNGTFLNGRRIDAHVGCRLALGDVVYFATKGYQIVADVDESNGSARSLFTTKVLGDSTEIRSVMQLLKVINEQRTYPHFQAIVDLVTQEPVGWEALGRATTEDGPMSPALMFELAKHNRVETKLSRRFRESAIGCARCHHCWKSDPGALLFLNLHPTEIPDGSFLASLQEFSDSEFRQLFRIVVEMPESWVCKTEDMLRLTQQIRSLGMLVAYDDFGVGQSRLPDLAKVPPDFVKIDRELIAQAAREKVQYDLVKAIVNACRKLGVRTLGEGIETEEELQACQDMRMDYGQGYLFGRPMPAYQLFHVPDPDLPRHCTFVRLDLLPRTLPNVAAAAGA